MLNQRTKTNAEKERKLEYGRKWRQKNKEKIKRWRLKNRKKIKLNKKKWKKKNPDYQRKWRLKNLDQVQKQDREYKRKRRKDPKFRENERAIQKKWFTKAMKNPEYRKMWYKRSLEWAKNNPEKAKETKHNYYERVRKIRLKTDIKYCEKTVALEILSEQKRAKRRRKDARAKKIQAIKICHPKGKVECIKKDCKETDLDLLVIEHTRGRKIMGHDKKFGGPKIVNWVINYYDKKGRPPGDLKPMCQSCNWEKEIERKRRDYRKKLVPQIQARRRR